LSIRLRPALVLFSILGALPLAGSEGSAADLRAVDHAASVVDGVDCEAPETAAFESVWLGHFSGGYSRHLGPGLPVVLDWRDEKLCFPSRHACDRYMSVMRREFHRPEGYFTCLPIR
jgi:hypothetical protein